MASVPSMFKVATVDFEDVRRGIIPIKRQISFGDSSTFTRRCEHSLLLFSPPPQLEEGTDSVAPNDSTLTEGKGQDQQPSPNLSASKFDKILADVTVKATQISSQVKDTLNTKVKHTLLDWATLVSHDLRLDALKDSHFIVLQQKPTAGDCKETEPAEELFLLFNSRRAEEAEESFRRLESILRPLLSWNQSEVEEAFLKDLIGLTGPLELNEMPKLLIKWCRHTSSEVSRRVSLDVNARYGDDKCLLHIVSESGQVDHIRSLVSIGADLTLVDKLGNSVYHNVVSKGYVSCLEVLIEVGKEKFGNKITDHLSIQNKNGHTPLMLATIYDFLQCAYVLALNSKSVNQQNEINGNTALHIAAQKGYLRIAKLLAVFDADINIKNKDGKTVLDIAECSHEKGSDACFQTLGALEVKDDKYSAEEIPSGDFQLDGPILLSVDGGGIRGLVEVSILSELEAILKERDPEYSYLSDYFDWIAGTSTGCYIVLGMVYHRFSVHEMRYHYLKVKEQGTELSRPYPDAQVNHFCQKVFSKDILLSEVTTPKVIVTTTLANRSPPELHLMCNYGEPRQGQKGPCERKIWEAARASSAAPTYFEAYENKFLDGGVMANNPTLDAMAEIVKEQKAAKEPLKIGLVVSLGTGIIASKTLTSINIQRKFMPNTVVGGLLSLKSLFEVLVAQVTASDGQEVDRAQAWCDTLNCPYFRLSPPIEYIELNEVSTEKLVQMMFFGLIYVKRIRGKLICLADMLIQRRKK